MGDDAARPRDDDDHLLLHSNSRFRLQYVTMTTINLDPR